MRIVIRSGHAAPAAMAVRARRRFEFALGRFGARVRSLTVRLSDLNGPKGGMDKQCRVAIRLDGTKRTIVIEHTDASAIAAIDRAAERAARAVARALDTLGGWRPIRPSA